MTIEFQVGIQESENGWDVHTLYQCDTEQNDVGSSEVAPFERFSDAFNYMKEQVDEYERSL